jgi:hypothetical protein
VSCREAALPSPYKSIDEVEREADVAAEKAAAAAAAAGGSGDDAGAVPGSAVSAVRAAVICPLGAASCLIMC